MLEIMPGIVNMNAEDFTEQAHQPGGAKVSGAKGPIQ
jgi:hypothetical protein